jgi:hypothetical protein
MTEPYVLSRNYMLGTQPIRPIDTPCVPGYEGQEPGTVPHYLPGKNPSIDEVSKFYNLPMEAVMGARKHFIRRIARSSKRRTLRP